MKFADSFPSLKRIIRRVRRTSHRLDGRVIGAVLNTLIPDRVDLLMVHSSLSACGSVSDGPETLLNIWRGRCTTLCLPSHAYCYPSLPGEPGPVFDPATTPGKVGAIPEWMRKAGIGQRSIHPTHAILADGPEAASLCEGHEGCETPCGSGTPYRKMIENGCSALMFGATMHSYTFFHTAEDASESPLAYEPNLRDRLRFLDSVGGICELSGRRQTRNPRRFCETAAVLERAGLLRRKRLGLGELLFIPDCRVVHRYFVERLQRHPDFLFADCPAPLDIAF